MKRKLNSVIFEGDTKLVVDALKNSPASSHGLLDYCVKDSKFAVNSFLCWDFSFVLLLVNFVAHNLAHWAAFCNLDGLFAPLLGLLFYR